MSLPCVGSEWWAGAVGAALAAMSPKPPACTPPPGPLLGVEVAMPLPNPALATTATAPRFPPVPLPVPEPVGRSNDPTCASLLLSSPLGLGTTPLGSPKPPVCTFATGREELGLALDPVENIPVVIFFSGAFGSWVAGIEEATFGVSTGR